MKKILGNTLIFTISNFIIQGLQFILLPLYSNLIATEEYGVIGTINTSTYLIGMIASLNLHGAISKYYFDCKSEEEVKEMYSKVTKATFQISSSIFAIVLIASYFAFSIFCWDGYLGFLLSVLAKYLICYSNLFQSFYIARQEAKIVAISTVCISLVNLLGTFVCVTYCADKVTGYFIGTLLSSIVGFVFFIIGTKRYIIRTTLAGVKRYINYSMAQIMSSLSFWIVSSSDRYVLTGIRGTGETGVYNMGANFGTVHNIVVMSFNNVYIPNTFKNLKNETNQRRQKTLMNAYFIINMWAVCGLIVLTKDIVSILNPAYWSCYSTAIILLVSSFITGVMQIYNGIVSFHVEALKRKNVIIALGAILNIILNFVLIPSQGAEGAAVATLVANLFIMIGLMVLSNSLVKMIALPLKEIILAALYIGVSYYFGSLYIKLGLSAVFTTILFLSAVKTGLKSLGGIK